MSSEALAPWSAALGQATFRSPAPEPGRRARRTRARLLEGAREVFLRRGFEAATVDEITAVAGVGRASFYTYFPSKRDVLMALGVDATVLAVEIHGRFGRLGPDSGVADVDHWVGEYVDFMIDHGAFMAVWIQAMAGDDELRGEARRAYLGEARRIGAGLARLRGRADPDDTLEGLAVMAMIAQTVHVCRAVGTPFERDDIQRILTRSLLAIVAVGNGDSVRPL